MPSPDYLPGSRFGIRAIAGDTQILDIDLWSQSLVSDIETKMLGYLEGTHAGRPAASRSNLIYHETDTGGYFFDNGTTWVQLAGPRTTHQTHVINYDDQTIPNPAASVLAESPVSPAGAEAVTFLGVVFKCSTVGSTPTVIKVQTDHAVHGTLADVPGLTGVTPAAGAWQRVLATTPFVASDLDGVAVVASTSGNSKGLKVALLTEHAA